MTAPEVNAVIQIGKIINIFGEAPKSRSSLLIPLAIGAVVLAVLVSAVTAMLPSLAAANAVVLAWMGLMKWVALAVVALLLAVGLPLAGYFKFREVKKTHEVVTGFRQRHGHPGVQAHAIPAQRRPALTQRTYVASSVDGVAVHDKEITR